MRPTEIMRGSPPAPEAQVTRANWRSFPAIRWGFTHTREVLPTAEVRRSAHPSPIRSAPRELAKLGRMSTESKDDVEGMVHRRGAAGFVAGHVAARGEARRGVATRLASGV